MSVADKRGGIKFFEQRVKISWLLKWSHTPKSSFYYQVLTGKRGRKLSTHTLLTDGSAISNESVVIAIRFILAEEFMIYTGYVKISKDLQSYGFIINKKKVYGLMKRYQLLCGSVIKTSGEKRKFVKWRVQKAVKPMEQLCMDIKYVYIQGEKRNALLLTVLDVYTRSIVGQVLWWRIRKEQVIWLLHKILQQHQPRGITLRNDNGSQFIAHAVREYLQDQHVEQEFTHVSTPEENCFIEAYHSILDKQLLQQMEFTDIEEAITVFNRWKKFYNERRRHGSIGQQSPKQLWNEYETNNFVPSGQAEAGNAGEQPARNNLMNGEVLEGVVSTPSIPENISVPMPQKTQKQTNCFENSVQLLRG
ncbi:MAG: DDE-type integrase/transposase/recombinase [Bacteroidetes bacterium]|nr:DDE-type integrase/transposase/recombinase [Bacteroidota bacterium]